MSSVVLHGTTRPYTAPIRLSYNEFTTMNEPIDKVPNSAGTGAPEISDEQFDNWLRDMSEFLKQGASLWYAMEKAGILRHKTVIYEKYRLKDWFSEKIDTYRAYVGELVNMVGFKTIQAIHNRMIESDGKVGIMSSEEVQVWKTMAEKHRTAQPFFVTRAETAQAKDEEFGKVVEPQQPTIEYVVPPSDNGENDQKQIDEPKQPAGDQVLPDAQTAPSVEAPNGPDSQ